MNKGRGVAVSYSCGRLQVSLPRAAFGAARTLHHREYLHCQEIGLSRSSSAKNQVIKGQETDAHFGLRNFFKAWDYTTSSLCSVLAPVALCSRAAFKIKQPVPCGTRWRVGK